jgi:hypothetical protein
MMATHSAFRFYRDGILASEEWSVFRRDPVQFKVFPSVRKMMPFFPESYSPDPAFVRELAAIEAKRYQGKRWATWREALEEGSTQAAAVP